MRNRSRNPSIENNATDYKAVISGLAAYRILDSYSGVAPVIPPTNWHPNPTVEVNSTGWVDDSSVGGVEVGALARSNVWAHDGTWSMYVHRQNAADAVNRSMLIRTNSPSGGASIPVQPTWVARVRIHLNVLVSTATTNVRAHILFRDSGGSAVGSTIQGPPAEQGATGEMRVEAVTTAPANAAFMQVSVNAVGSNAWDVELYIDDVFVALNESLADPLTIPADWPADGSRFLSFGFHNPDTTLRRVRLQLAPGGTDGLRVDAGEVLRIRAAAVLFDETLSGHRLRLVWLDEAGDQAAHDSYSNTYFTADEAHVLEMTTPVPPDAFYVRPEVEGIEAEEDFSFDGHLDAVGVYEATSRADDYLPFDPDRTFRITGDTHYTTEPYEQLLRNTIWETDLRMNPEIQEVVKWFHIGDLTDNGLSAQDAVAQAHIEAVRGEIPFYPTMGNHDVQFDGRTPQAWADEWELALPYYTVEDLDWIRFIILAPEGTAPDISAEVLAWAEAQILADVSRPTWILNHFPLRNTVLGDAGLHNISTVSDYAKPDVELRALIDAHPSVVGYVSGHLHVDIARQPDWLKTENVGTRTIHHLNCTCPAYTGHTIPSFPVRTLYVEMPADPWDDPLVHIRDHILQAWIDADPANPVPYVVEPAVPYEPRAYIDGDAVAWQWDGTADNSASREMIAPRPRRWQRSEQPEHAELVAELAL